MDFSLLSAIHSSFSLQQWLSILLLIISSINIFSTIQKRSHGDKLLPPQLPRAWPLLGHLHLFGNDPPHIVLGTMADKFGPMFTMLFGTHKTIVISSSDIAKECFTSTNDKLFSYRVVPTGIQQMFYNHVSFGFAPYGAYWREMRKMGTLSLFSNHRVEMLDNVRTSQVNIWFKNLYEKSCNSSNGVGIELKSWFDEMVFHILVNMIVEPDDETLMANYRKATTEAGRLMAGFVVSDLVPYLGELLDYLFGTTSNMMKTAKAMDSILTTWLEQHKKRLNGGRGLIGDLLSMQESALFGHDRDTVIKSAVQVLIMGGSDSTSATITWVMSLLLKHSDIFEKAKEELVNVVGNGRQVADSDIKDLVYLRSILKETMRLYPVAPLLERLAMEDCIVGGFHVEAGTRVFVNVSKVQRDPNVWLDPMEFKPERFLTGCNVDVDLKGQDHEFLPFGSGRRLCPAVNFSVRVMLLIIARFIHSFDVKRAEMDGALDMSESSGLTNCRSSPLEVMISPRLDAKIYG